MNAILEELCNRMLGGMLNGVYQGLLLTVGLMLIFRLARGLNAATRHAVGLTALGMVALLPLFHFIFPPSEKTTAGQGDGPIVSSPASDGSPREGGTLGGGTDRLSIAAQEAFSRLENPDPGAMISIFVRDRQSEELEGSAPAKEVWAMAEREGVQELGAPVPKNQEGKGEEGRASDRENEASSGLFPGVRAGGEGAVERPIIETPPPSIGNEPFLSWLSAPWSLELAVPGMVGFILIILWIVPALGRIGGLAWQHHRLHQLRRRGIRPPAAVCELHEQLRKEWGLRRKAELMMSEETAVPMVLGFRRPAILLPARLVEELDEVQMEHVLRHELAHVRRRDDWANLFQQMIKALFFFHPAVCWLSRRLTIEREIACDDHVLAVAANPRAYALFLTEFAGRARRRHWTAAPAAWSNQSQLKERIVMILDTKRNTSPRLARASVGVLTTAAVLLALLAVQAGPRLALGQDEATSASEAVAASAGHAASFNSHQEAALEANLEIESEIESDLELAEPPPPPQPAPVPARVHPGPKPKLHPVQPPPAGVLPTAPLPPRPAIAMTHLPLPMLGNVPHLAMTAAPRSELRGEASLERRLERLERLVESLLERDKKRAPSSGHAPSFMDGKHWENFSKELQAEMEKMGKLGLNEEMMARIKEQARKAGERAAQEAKRASEQYERALSQLMDKLHSEHPEVSHKTHLDQQRQQLEAQRRSLEKQMENLERQMARLEAERDRMEAERDRMEAEQDRREVEREKSQKEKSKDKTLKPSKTPPPSSESESPSEEDEKKVKKY